MRDDKRALIAASENQCGPYETAIRAASQPASHCDTATTGKRKKQHALCWALCGHEASLTTIIRASYSPHGRPPGAGDGWWTVPGIAGWWQRSPLGVRKKLGVNRHRRYLVTVLRVAAAGRYRACLRYLRERAHGGHAPSGLRLPSCPVAAVAVEKGTTVAARQRIAALGTEVPGAPSQPAPRSSAARVDSLKKCPLLQAPPQFFSLSPQTFR